MLRAFALLVLPVACLTAVRGAAAQTPFPSHEVRVRVTVGAEGVAAVREDFMLTSPLRPATFELLENSCASIGAFSANTDGRRVDLHVDRESRAPWTTVRITPTDPGRSLQLSYDVRLAGSEAAIPIAVPSTTLERADDSRGAQVDVAVDFDGGLTAARVLIPRLERSPAGTGWTARLLAMPAFVRVGVRSGSDPDLTPVRPQSRFSAEFRASCPGRIDGSTGRLEWRFVVFVATMGVWVPVYFWWFARRRGAQL